MLLAECDDVEGCEVQAFSGSPYFLFQWGILLRSP